MDLIYRQQALDAIRNIKAITGTSDDEILLIDKAEAQTELMMLPSAQQERPSKIQDILNYLDTVLHPIISPEHWNVY